MKKLILLTLAMAGLGLAQGQSLQLFRADGATITNNTVVVLAEEPGHTEILSYFDVKNNSGANLNVLCKKTEFNLITGSTNSFCWTQCYPPFTYVSPTPITINAGQADTISFVGEYYSNGNTGTSRISYTFFDQANANDSIRVIVDYAYNVTALPEPGSLASMGLSSAYPNPASAQTSFNYDLPTFRSARLSIMNLLGSELRRIPIENRKGRLNIDLRDLTEGVYFYTLYLDGQASATHKLVIKR
ncbi:MAG TPA: T9SS type A sorting domain-containing protein [Bacteroidales bacterium]|nr:T9SS type A sorting domain-containing protein [Bacteroidales bacterium]